jgi:aminoglycoside 6'-N-acetyltransferase I
MIRKIHTGDKAALEEILKRVPNFKSTDVEVALELINISINFPEQKDYNIFVYEIDGKVAGYHCTGKRPITDAVYDLYWIVVDPLAAGKGIGRELLAHAEKFVIEQNGRLILAETSSKENYGKTKEFYFKCGYELLAEIKHFYSPGESLLIYGKYMWNNK